MVHLEKRWMHLEFPDSFMWLGVQNYKSKSCHVWMTNESMVGNYKRVRNHSFENSIITKYFCSFKKLEFVCTSVYQYISEIRV